LPVTGWGMAQLAGYKDSVPVAVAAAMLLFLFERSHSIFGGNIASNISSEYSESIALALAVLALGVAARGLTTGRPRAPFAGLMALVIFLFALNGERICAARRACICKWAGLDGLGSSPGEPG
jgi:hypothetical protein